MNTPQVLEEKVLRSFPMPISALEAETDESQISLEGKAVTEAEYWEHYYEYSERNYEWNNGILEEKPVSDFQNCRMFDWFIELLRQYRHTYANAEYTGTDFGFRLALKEKTSIRKPDLGIVLNTNSASLRGKDRSYRGTYDMCVELLSDSSKKDRERDTIHKKSEYAKAGIKEYFILHVDEACRAFYRLDKNGRYREIKPDKDGVIHSKVLVDFRFRIQDLLDMPLIEEMSVDPLYAHFVMPAHKKALDEAERQRQRAVQEAQRAEMEAQRAEMEAQRAEMEAQRAETEKRRADEAEAEIARLKAELSKK